MGNLDLQKDDPGGYLTLPMPIKATFFQSPWTQRFLRTLKTRSCWYSLDSSRSVLSDEYHLRWFRSIFRVFLQPFVLAKLANVTSVRVNASEGVYKLHSSVPNRMSPFPSLAIVPPIFTQPHPSSYSPTHSPLVSCAKHVGALMMPN